MSTEKTAPATAPQTLTEFQQQFAAAVIANMKASNEALLASVQEQQTRLEAAMQAATTELMQRFGYPVQPPPRPGGAGQSAAAPTPPAAAGPT